MRIRVKRCEVCASKLNKDGKCTWEGCPKSPKYETGAKDEAKPKTEAPNS